jgi:two-component system NtrC family response regulator
MVMAKVLVVDDEKAICDAVVAVGQSMGHEVAWALTLEDGLKKASSIQCDVVFLDIHLPDGDGLKALQKIAEAPSEPEVIIITGRGDPDGAELAIRNGAWDYIEKPLSVDGIKLPVLRALQYRAEKATQKPPTVLKRDAIVGTSLQIRGALQLVSQAANTATNVLVRGETGTGKELFARAIHDNSCRAHKNFVVVDCAALPETLVESILFGHEKGAFTGADRARGGLVEQADGGTLFLDEVGELPLTVQGAFLRVLEERRFRPVGGKHELTCDFRLVAASNRDLDKMVEEGTFRNDLLFRLRSMVIDLPALRERSKDIKDIALYYMNRFCDRYGKGTKGFSPDFIDALNAYTWPGNVRELVHTVERALSTAGDDATLFPVHLPNRIRIALARASAGKGAKKPVASKPSMDPSEGFFDLRTLLNATERQYLEDLLSTVKGDMKEACRISGLSRSRLYDRLKKYKIQRPS